MDMWRDSLQKISPIRFFFCRDPRAWSMPRVRPHASWLRKVESYLKDAGMAGLASAWAMARRRAKEYRRKVDAATRFSAVCPHTCPALRRDEETRQEQNLAP